MILNRDAPSLRVMPFILLLWALLPAAAAFADMATRDVACGCYCGKVLNPPCSADACKSACGWSSGTGSGIGSGTGRRVNLPTPRLVGRNMNSIMTNYAMQAGMQIFGQMMNQAVNSALQPPPPSTANPQDTEFVNAVSQEQLQLQQEAEARQRKIDASSASIKEAIDRVRQELGLLDNPGGIDFDGQKNPLDSGNASAGALELQREDFGDSNVVDLSDKTDLTVNPDVVSQGGYPVQLNDAATTFDQMTPEQKAALQEKWNQLNGEDSDTLQKESAMADNVPSQPPDSSAPPPAAGTEPNEGPKPGADVPSPQIQPPEPSQGLLDRGQFGERMQGYVDDVNQGWDKFQEARTEMADKTQEWLNDHAVSGLIDQSDLAKNIKEQYDEMKELKEKISGEHEQTISGLFDKMQAGASETASVNGGGRVAAEMDTFTQARGDAYQNMAKGVIQDKVKGKIKEAFEEEGGEE